MLPFFTMARLDPATQGSQTPELLALDGRLKAAHGEVLS